MFIAPTGTSAMKISQPERFCTRAVRNAYSLSVMEEERLERLYTGMAEPLRPDLGTHYGRVSLRTGKVRPCQGQHFNAPEEAADILAHIYDEMPADFKEALPAGIVSLQRHPRSSATRSPVMRTCTGSSMSAVQGFT